MTLTYLCMSFSLSSTISSLFLIISSSSLSMSVSLCPWHFLLFLSFHFPLYLSTTFYLLSSDIIISLALSAFSHLCSHSLTFLSHLLSVGCHYFSLPLPFLIYIAFEPSQLRSFSDISIESSLPLTSLFLSLSLSFSLPFLIYLYHFLTLSALSAVILWHFYRIFSHLWNLFGIKPFFR